MSQSTTSSLLEDVTSTDLHNKKQFYSDDELKKLMKIDFTYPEPTDDQFQEKIFKKREFYYHKIDERPEVKTYNDLKTYRESACRGQFKLLPQQAFLGNFMNEQTPFQSVLVYHGMGVGKCLIGTELIYVNSTLMTIEKLYNILSDGLIIIDQDNGQWSTPTSDTYINSFDNETNKVQLKKINKLYREFIDQTVRKVILENGLEINMTKAHKLLVNEQWSNNLKVGDYIAIPTILYGNLSHNEIEEPIVKAVVSYLYLYDSPNQTVFNMNIIDCAKYLTSKNIVLLPYNVPHFIMSSSLNTIKLFLLIYHNLTNNEIKSTSKYFIYQMYHLAILLKIKANITSKKQIYTLHLDFTKQQNNDTEYVKIISIKEYYHKNYVYDLEIDDTHNYCANSIITHNTCAAITIAEQFKSLVHKYGTKIYVVVPGPLIKENWKNELLTCTGETYLKKQDITTLINEDDKKKMKAMALNNALQFYTFPSYKSFYKNVLGEKITEKSITDDEKVKITFRKTADGEFERDFPADRITELNNTVLIVEEAHNLTNNSYGASLLKIIKKSHNLKIVLLTGTPMKNLASDIIELMHFIRPQDDPIIRDKIFTKHTNHEMDFVKGGIEYLKKMTKGYVSYLRGGDPLTMAKRVDMGQVGNGMMFTKITSCHMSEFQHIAYDSTVALMDVLDRNSAAVANFAFPKLDENRNLIGAYGIEGVNTVKNQLKLHGDLLNKKIALDILKDPSLKNSNDLIYLNDKTNMITGKILHMDHLRNFSTKFYECLKNLNDLIYSKSGAVTAFVYSNLVVVGVDVFQEVLLMNGYLEYSHNYNNYKIDENTRCYYCGKNNLSHSKTASKDKEHTFRPATFVTVTGKSSDEAETVIPEEKQQILDNVFSNVDNIDGKFIKFVVGSRVMNEGLSLHNVKEVHILDVYYNLSKVDQTIGRAIRHCRHYDIMDELNPYPEVKVYKYCVSLDKNNSSKLSSEEELYRKAELKYLLVKKVERAIKEVAIDCPLNRNGNIYPEEIEQYKNCVEPQNITSKDQVMCPAVCDFTDCNYKCDEKELNDKYFDKDTMQYKKLSKDQIDMTTFNNSLAISEIKFAKDKIKELFRIKYLYLLKDILNYVRNSYDNEKKDLFDEFFVFAALNDLIPISENDFNKYSDTIYDKYNRPGYVIYVSKYYIFQPFDQPANVPMYYRSTMDKPLQNSLSLVSYLKNVKGVEETTELKIAEETSTKVGIYDFDDAYYENRQEFKYVGTIDKEPSKKKVKEAEELMDIFKLRKQQPKILAKKRGVEIYSLHGSVCYNSFKKKELEKIAKVLEINLGGDNTRTDICETIKDRLLFLEKYSTDKNKNKFTYVMIPKNHVTYKFPYNLEDRKDFVLNDLKKEFGTSVNVSVKDVKRKDVIEYVIEIKNSGKLDEYFEFLKKIGFDLEKDLWTMKID